MSLKEDYMVKRIPNELSKEWLLHTHYAKRRCSCSYSFGLINKQNEIFGVCTFGSPASRPLCKGICGADYQHLVLELNRLVIKDNLGKNAASFFVSACLKQLKPPLIIVSYADTSQNHTGYIYQACNFLYTGLSAKRTEWRMKNSNLHSKSICDRYKLEERKNNADFYLAQRPQKHRYILFLGNKREKKELLKKLKYKISPYPKGDNKNYKIDFYPNQKYKGE